MDFLFGDYRLADVRLEMQVDSTSYTSHAIGRKERLLEGWTCSCWNDSRPFPKCNLMLLNLAFK